MGERRSKTAGQGEARHTSAEPAPLPEAAQVYQSALMPSLFSREAKHPPPSPCKLGKASGLDLLIFCMPIGFTLDPSKQQQQNVIKIAFIYSIVCVDVISIKNKLVF